VVRESYTLNRSFKHTTGDYMDAGHPLKPLEKNISMTLQRDLHNNT
jgi:hypothetical protein